MSLGISLSLFQSTHLLRGATYPGQLIVALTSVFQSTHLLRGATIFTLSLSAIIRHFNPRTSYEVRPAPFSASVSVFLFQSTHLLRGATSHRQPSPHNIYISIHAPLTRCDLQIFAYLATYIYFNPRTSYEVRRREKSLLVTLYAFQSTHLLRGATRSARVRRSMRRHFNPRTSYEVRRYNAYKRK